VTRATKPLAGQARDRAANAGESLLDDMTEDQLIQPVMLRRRGGAAEAELKARAR
jgi:hypothetical protein